MPVECPVCTRLCTAHTLSAEYSHSYPQEARKVWWSRGEPLGQPRSWLCDQTVFPGLLPPLANPAVESLCTTPTLSESLCLTPTLRAGGWRALGKVPAAGGRFFLALAWPVAAPHGLADAARWESLALRLISGQMFGTGSAPKGSQRESCVTNGTNQSGSTFFRGKLVEPSGADPGGAARPGSHPGLPGAPRRAPALLAGAALLAFQIHCFQTPAWRIDTVSQQSVGLP